ncbi:MAG: fasciclin domain-containing protein [Burkholderiales bacterium]
MKFGSKKMMGILALGAAVGLPAVAHAGAGHIIYQQKKADMEARERVDAGKGTVLDVLKLGGQFETFLKAVDAAGMTNTLKSPGTFTVFAPTDDAFSRIPTQELQALLKDTTKLRDVIENHIVAQKHYGWDLRRDALKSMDGNTLQIAQYVSPQDIRINGNIDVLDANMKASNGVVHAIDGVLMPEG